MKTWLISDTHGLHRKLIVPPDVELIIHSGDESTDPRVHFNNNEALDFFEWFSNLYIPHKIFVPGNHSIAFFHKLIKPEQYPNIIFLVDSSYELNGIKFFGSPWTPTFGSDKWVYIKSRHIMNKVWSNIPNDTNYLITHGPPQGILDLAVDYDGNGRQRINVGCKSLMNKVKQLTNLKYHQFGHIHPDYNKGLYNYGILKQNITYINASVCNNNYDLVNHGYILDV